MEEIEIPIVVAELVVEQNRPTCKIHFCVLILAVFSLFSFIILVFLFSKSNL